MIDNIGPADNEVCTKEQELTLVYETLLEAAETVKNDPTLAQFVASANQDLVEFQQEYPEICAEYDFNQKEKQC